MGAQAAIQWLCAPAGQKTILMHRTIPLLNPSYLYNSLCSERKHRSPRKNFCRTASRYVPFCAPLSLKITGCTSAHRQIILAWPCLTRPAEFVVAPPGPEFFTTMAKRLQFSVSFHDDKTGVNSPAPYLGIKYRRLLPSPAIRKQKCRPLFHGHRPSGQRRHRHFLPARSSAAGRR